jgi:hypothetical protein
VELPGKGTVDVAVGTLAWHKELGKILPGDEDQVLAKAAENQGKIVVFFAVGAVQTARLPESLLAHVACPAR